MFNIEYFDDQTEQNQTDQNQTEQDQTDQNKTDQNQTDQNQSEQDQTDQNQSDQNEIKNSDGIIKWNTDPPNMNETIDGVIDSVPKDQVKEYVIGYEEPDPLDTVQYENKFCYYKEEKEDQLL
jgi:hypothetical protein